MTDRTSAAAPVLLTTVLLTAGLSLAVLVTAVLVVGVLAFAAPDFASSKGFYWTSAAVAVLIQIPTGLFAARVGAPRLRRVGVSSGRSLLILCALGPAVLALLANARPIEDVPPVVHTLLPVCAVILGAMVGLRTLPGASSPRRKRANASLY
ncbi:hypothetical protein [Actinomadura roseirufa]|uniref:hypothetical protein n=1 Tax=Actinomadura roseirufa TaxID=2094049 RepID=UPI0010414B82|nr:hypothetical protein [Actinomadura roseirufa]